LGIKNVLFFLPFEILHFGGGYIFAEVKVCFFERQLEIIYKYLRLWKPCQREKSSL
jgi:hypothetical protein